MNLRKGLSLAFSGALLFPFLFLVFQFPFVSWPDWDEIFWAFKNSFNQASLSALLSVSLGLWGALGLLRIRSSSLRATVEVLCLIPNFIPALFVLLAVLNVVRPFPMGIPGIVIIHTLINIGLCALLLSRAFETRAGGMLELALVEGAPRWRLLWSGVLPLLRRDIALTFLFVFIICFSSFSIPLIVGGGKGTTLEVLIYERIRLSSDWSQAVLIAALQSIFIFVLAMVLRQRDEPTPSSRVVNTRAIQSLSGMLPLVGAFAIVVVGYILGVIEGVRNLEALQGLQYSFLSAFLNTLYVGLVTGGLVLAGLLLTAFCWPLSWFDRFLSSYVAPSTALACFAFLVLGPNTGWMPFLKIPLVLFILNITSLYRLGWSASLKNLKNQYVVAQLMGASHTQIFSAVLLPQLMGRLGLLSGLGAVWACGDFAVSRILAHRDFTLGMFVETLMSSYRLNQATALSVLLIIASVLCFTVFWGGSHVVRKKLTSGL